MSFLFWKDKKMKLRGIRGAITVYENNADDILCAVKELMEAIIATNKIEQDDVTAILFTATNDLDAAYPARAVRDMGWTMTPLSCCQEMAVEESLEKCIRVLILWNTNVDLDQVKHIYLKQASQLRPDLT